jgi:hypothetical protein
VTVVATDKSKVYGDVNPTLTATVTGAVGTDVINYTLATTAVTGSNVGTYPIVTLERIPTIRLLKLMFNVTKSGDCKGLINQKYMEMKPCAYCCGYWCCGTRCNQIPATTASHSNVGQYPIAVTLELILTILLFQLMVF